MSYSQMESGSGQARREIVRRATGLFQLLRGAVCRGVQVRLDAVKAVV